jgi:hypothetical protein
MLNVIAGMILLVGSNASETPTDAEILRAMPQISRRVPGVYEEFRDDIVIVKNLLVQRVVTRSLFVGMSVSAVKETWECTVYHYRVIQSDFPFPVRVRKLSMQMIYIDKLKAPKLSLSTPKRGVEADY